MTKSNLILRSQGQGMTEYLIIVALIAVAAIGVFSFFGQTIRHQVAAISDEMTGTSASDQLNKALSSAKGARNNAGEKVNLGTYSNTATDGTL